MHYVYRVYRVVLHYVLWNFRYAVGGVEEEWNVTMTESEPGIVSTITSFSHSLPPFFPHSPSPYPFNFTSYHHFTPSFLPPPSLTFLSFPPLSLPPSLPYIPPSPPFPSGRGGRSGKGKGGERGKDQVCSIHEMKENELIVVLTATIV